MALTSVPAEPGGWGLVSAAVFGALTLIVLGACWRIWMDHLADDMVERARKAGL